jgi:hypothetical protein
MLMAWDVLALRTLFTVRIACVYLFFFKEALESALMAVGEFTS